MNIEDGRWVPSIGDPTVMGWATVVVYFIVALLCFKAAAVSLSVEEKHIKSVKIFWSVLFLFLIFLGINKQLDLQSLVTQIGKDMAISQGWYKDRRMVQFIFIIFIGVFGVTGLTMLIIIYRHTYLGIKIALTGCLFLFGFILVRASSFHHMDEFINFQLAGVKMNWLFELGGLSIIAGGAMNFLVKNTHAGKYRYG